MLAVIIVTSSNRHRFCEQMNHYVNIGSVQNPTTIIYMNFSFTVIFSS